MTRSMGHELAKYGITVNAIVPGAILTPMTMAFLASDEASYVNATSVTVDGGFL